MTSNSLDPSTTRLTVEEMTAMLRAVGLDGGAAPKDLDTTFEDLGLDSLARVEVAARIFDTYGVDVETQLTPGTTPRELESLVNSRIGDAA